MAGYNHCPPYYNNAATMITIKSLRSNIFSGLLFCFLGIAAWMLLSNYRGANERITAVAESPWACLFMVIVFVMLGFMSLRVSSWLTMHYMLKTSSRWKISLAYAAVAAIYLLIDYGFLVSAKLLSDTPQPLSLPYTGKRLLLMVWLVEMGILGLLLANRAMAQVFRAQQHMAQIEEDNATARYTALQSQLNPHFLFNSLNTLLAEIEDNPQQAASFTRCMADVYRYVLQVQQKKLVTVGDELDFAQSYLYLHRVRLGNCVECRTDITEEQRYYNLPPLTLQLLLENVFKHNFVSASHPMNIHISISNGWLVISNSLQPKQPVHSEGVGLDNLTSRCRMTTGKDIIVDADNKSFTVKIPLLYE